MSRFEYSDEERAINAVLVNQEKALSSIECVNINQYDVRIESSESLLTRLGYQLPDKEKLNQEQGTNKELTFSSWSNIAEEALMQEGYDCALEDLFSQDELEESSRVIRELNEAYNQLHRLDKIDIAICISAGLLSAAINILLVGVPKKTKGGLKAGPLSDCIRDYFEKIFPAEDMERLARQAKTKVPYDAQDNRNTTVDVEGLSAYYHRLLSLGHDPLLGLVFGTLDIINGTMTTIDKNGKIVVQLMENYTDRREADIFAALAKQFVHLATDVNTSMGLPVPLMGLFNLLQVGKIGKEEQTIAEIVQGMYYEGYDFIHFCSMSVPVMVTEVIVRIAYAFKCLSEGKTIKESIPVNCNHSQHPKLGTMLFIAHSLASAINAGEVYFTEKPTAINYPQWIAFSKYAFQQAKWVLLDKPEFRDEFVLESISADLDEVYARINSNFSSTDSAKFVL